MYEAVVKNYRYLFEGETPKLHKQCKQVGTVISWQSVIMRIVWVCIILSGISHSVMSPY